MTNCSFSMITADDDGSDLNSTDFDLTSGRHAVADDSFISDRV